MLRGNGIDKDGFIDFRSLEGYSELMQFVRWKAFKFMGANGAKYWEVCNEKTHMESLKKEEGDLNRLFQEAKVKMFDLMPESEGKGGLLQPWFYGFLIMSYDIFNEQFKALKGFPDQARDLDLEIVIIEFDFALLCSLVDQATTKFEKKIQRICLI